MQSILEYIMLNYTWFLGGAIVILLAIIGSYADKTNFGQGKQKNEKEETLPEIRLNDLMENQEVDEIVETDSIADTTEENPDKVEELVVEDVKEDSIDKVEKLEENFAKFDQVFNEFVPKKDIIDEELLDEIDSLSLDKTQKLKLTDIPDLDDVELPKIKSLSSVDEDIWKF